MTPGPAYDREGVRRFVEALRARHGLTDPEAVTTRPRPAQPPLVAADGAVTGVKGGPITGGPSPSPRRVETPSPLEGGGDRACARVIITDATSHRPVYLLS